jgi:hypothetical protein
MKNYRRKARIAWRRGQWATVEAFLRGDHVKRAVGPGMEIPEDGTTSPTDAAIRAESRGQVPMSPRLDQLESWSGKR